MRFRVSLAVLGLFLVASGVRALAQDRIILFESYIRQRFSTTNLPGEIREIEITEGGRGWLEISRAPLPTHTSKTPVALADGSKIMWLANDRYGPWRLAQYDRRTGRASLVDVGQFDVDAFLVADRPRPRVFVIERRRITVIDERLRPSALDLEGPMTIFGATVGDGTLILRRSTGFTEADVVIIDSATGAITRTIPLNQQLLARAIISRDGQRLYRAYQSSYQHYLEVLSLATGEVLARASNVQPEHVFTLDESRGVLISDQPAPSSTLRRAFQVRDARTLALVAEFGLGFFEQVRQLALAQTSDAILVESQDYVQSYFDDGCPSRYPRLTFFDPNTFTPVRQINLQRRCPVIVPLPSR